MVELSGKQWLNTDLDVLADELAPLLADRLNPQPKNGWLRGAEAIAKYIGAPKSRVYALSSAGRIPLHHDGANLVALSHDLDEWLRDGGGKRS